MSKIAKTSRIRIIGGRWRSRLIELVDAEGLRPTGNRQRETLFNWLAFDIAGRCCLDLFAGSGALGLEALSRGAQSCTFVESNPKIAFTLLRNLEAFELNNNIACVEQQTAEVFLNSPSNDNKSTTPIYNLIFIDPPFDQQLWISTARMLEAFHHLADDALIYVEAPTYFESDLPHNWQKIKERKFGDNISRLYQRQLS